MNAICVRSGCHECKLRARVPISKVHVCACMCAAADVMNASCLRECQCAMFMCVCMHAAADVMNASCAHLGCVNGYSPMPRLQDWPKTSGKSHDTTVMSKWLLHMVNLGPENLHHATQLSDTKCWHCIP